MERYERSIVAVRGEFRGRRSSRTGPEPDHTLVVRGRSRQVADLQSHRTDVSVVGKPITRWCNTEGPSFGRIRCHHDRFWNARPVPRLTVLPTSTCAAITHMSGASGARPRLSPSGPPEHSRSAPATRHG